MTRLKSKMKNPRQKLIAVDPETFEKIRILAESTHRTMGGMVMDLYDAAVRNKTYEIISMSVLPHPVDGESIPVAYVKEQSK